MKKLIFLALSLTGCQTYQFEEPLRSQYLAECILEAHLTSTMCLCIESKFVKSTGITTLTRENTQTFKDFLENALTECAAEQSPR